ncbi:PREDICTED: uncharacterized protein LOC104810585 [Tarenaya hassleriana]|uniref:uncharacterized protein LOC104810585 n=1 Tax=Tarenaya hassleriana TaxID=28532 RepID=UPI00053C5C66|nr:PREDICTED: uncharacterized protein LOC104810585 [Tarenaya hassleriana]
MDITSTELNFQSRSLSPPDMQNKAEAEPRNTNPFAEAFPDDDDPLCRINLKETADFVKSFPVLSNSKSGNNMGNERRESLSSQKSIGGGSSSSHRRGRQFEVYRYVSGGGGRRRNFPSKWVDAEKWVTSGHESPAHSFKNSPSNIHFDGFKVKQQVDLVFSEKSRVTEEKVTRTVSAFHGSPHVDHHSSYGVKGFNGSVSSSPTDLLLKDKLADEVQQILPRHKALDPSTEGFLFRNSADEPTGDSSPEKFLRQDLQHRDVGTEMTPLGSLTVSRCHTPFKSSSPARHNTPSKMSGPLTAETKGVIDISEFADKLRLGGTAQYDSVTSNWSSREEEEEEISKSLRHFDAGSELRRSFSESKANLWDEEEKIKYCQRYQREEARIQAWVSLQSAKAEAQSRKLEVKIQKMRSNLEEKQMKRMTAVHRRAEEWRATARRQHIEQMQRAAAERSRKTVNRRGSAAVVSRSSCGCFPCHNNHSYYH